MDRLGWRLRLFVGRFIPHTVSKRWGYGLGVVLALLLGLVSPLLAGGGIIALAALRWLDLKRSAARRPKLHTRPYFFEGPEDDPGS